MDLELVAGLVFQLSDLSPATSPLSRTELFHCTALFHCTLSKVADTTYLGRAFSRVARGSPGSVTCNQ